MIITLTTDFGVQDGFPAVMKGVIYNLALQVKIVDISHTIAVQDIREGAYTLWRAAPFFTQGTIHIYVVDPALAQNDARSRRGLVNIICW